MRLEVVDLRLRQHATVTDQDHARQAEAPLELADLIRDGARISGVAGINLYGNRSAKSIGDHAIDHDRLATLTIPAMAKVTSGQVCPS